MKAKHKRKNIIVDYFIYDDNFNELKEFVKEFDIIRHVEEFDDEGEIIIDIFGSEILDDELSTPFPILVIGNGWFETISMKRFNRTYTKL